MPKLWNDEASAKEAIAMRELLLVKSFRADRLVQVKRLSFKINNVLPQHSYLIFGLFAKNSTLKLHIVLQRVTNTFIMSILRTV